jgi:acyl-CoA thioester hydrolase
MPAIFEHPLTVAPEDIDPVGHVNNVEYLRWLQDAAIAHSAAQGWSMDRHRTLGHGWVVRSHTIEYRSPAFAGDELVIRTWISTLARVTSMRRYEITRPADGTILAVAQTNWAYVTFATHAPCRIPKDVAEAFEIVPDAG